MGTGGNALAAAASQAIAATQQLVPGRRTSSLKASYEAIHLGVQSHEFQGRYPSLIRYCSHLRSQENKRHVTLCGEGQNMFRHECIVQSTLQIGRELAGATQSALAASGLAGLGGGADSPIPGTSSGQPSTKRQKTNK